MSDCKMYTRLNIEPKSYFPNCTGAIDGKHIGVYAPDNSGSMYFSYKGSFSIGLLAITDSYYKFTHVDIGEYGKSSDAGAFSSSTIGEAMENGTIPWPDPVPLPGTNEPMPYVMVGDEGYPLKKYLMRCAPVCRIRPPPK